MESFGSSIAKRKRTTSCPEMSSGIDRISNLPDSVLSHILSFLPIRCAVATSALSRRWEFVWTGMVNLDFRSLVGHNHSFGLKHIVYRMLLMCRSQCLSKFALEIDCDTSDLDNWLCTLSSRNVQELDLSLFHQDYFYQLPDRLFTSTSLVVLVLSNEIVIDFPNSICICLPKLKRLQLLEVTYMDDEAAPKLISGCLVLEELVIQRSAYDNVENYCISSSTLKHLKIDLSNDEDELTDRLVYALEIDAPAVEHLSVMDSLTQGFPAVNLCSLIEADIELGPIGYGDNYFPSLLKFVKPLSNVKRIHVTYGKCSNLGYGRLSAKYQKLVSLDMHIDRFKWNLLHELLEGSVNLEVITLEQKRKHGSDDAWCHPPQVPVCLSLSLASFSVLGLEDNEGYLGMIRYILKNARVLRKVRIKTRNDLDQAAKFNLLQKISKFSRGSVMCKIDFS